MLVNVTVQYRKHRPVIEFDLSVRLGVVNRHESVCYSKVNAYTVEKLRRKLAPVVRHQRLSFVTMTPTFRRWSKTVAEYIVVYLQTLKVLR